MSPEPTNPDRHRARTESPVTTDQMTTNRKATPMTSTLPAHRRHRRGLADRCPSASPPAATATTTRPSTQPPAAPLDLRRHDGAATRAPRPSAPAAR